MNSKIKFSIKKHNFSCLAIILILFLNVNFQMTANTVLFEFQNMIPILTISIIEALQMQNYD